MTKSAARVEEIFHQMFVKTVPWSKMETKWITQVTMQNCLPALKFPQKNDR